MKNCKKCLETLDDDKFPINKDCIGGRSNACKKCKNKQSIEWQKSERGLKITKERYEKNKEHIASVKKRYSQTEKGKEVIRKSVKKYLASEKGQMHRKNVRNIRRVAKRETDITPEFLVHLKNRIGDICPYCLEYNIGKWELDHIVPVSKGGTHTQDNVLFCCSDCNKKKSDKYIDEINLCVRS